MKTKITVCGLIVPLVLFFAACKEVPPEEKQDDKLVGTWKNTQEELKQVPDDEDKLFTIKKDFTFVVNIKPGGAQMDLPRASLKGWLKRDSGDVYMIDGLRPLSLADTNVWTTMAAAYDKQYVKITFTDNDTFVFVSANNNESVTEYFGGTYYRDKTKP